jgi:carbonic anhydrase
MCDYCAPNSLTRRGALALAGLGAAFAATMTTTRSTLAADGPGTSLTPDQALAQLQAGNRRYVASPEACVINMTKRREEVAGGQAPWATVVSCADSRVPPELIFGGLSLGELFVVRNAGNTVDTAALGTLEYGAAVLKSPLIVVMGHQSCGAVQAACDVVTKNATYPGAIGPMIEPIVPAAIAARARRRFRRCVGPRECPAHGTAPQGDRAADLRPVRQRQGEDRRRLLPSGQRQVGLHRVTACRPGRQWVRGLRDSSPCTGIISIYIFCNL